MDTHSPICPRCAYNLSGIVESWQDSCPLEGTCSECGLTFGWRDIIAGPLRLPRWSFEHATANRLLPTFLGTLCRTLVPGRLWRDLRLEMRISQGRLIAFALLGLITCKAVGVLILGGTALGAPYLSNWGGVRWGSWRDSALDVLWPYGAYGGWWGSRELVSPWFAIAMLTALLTPAAFFLLPVSLRRAKVSVSHLVRVQTYCIASLPFVLGMWSLLRSLHIVADELWWDLASLIGSPYDEGFRPRVGLLSILWTVAILVRFWSAAVGRYLRMDHPRSVASAMVVVSLLMSALLVTLTYGYSLFW